MFIILKYCIYAPILWTEEPGMFTVHGVARVGHDLETKPPPPIYLYVWIIYILYI